MDNERSFRSKYESRVLPFYKNGRFGEFAGVGGLKIRYLCFEKKNTSGALVVLPGKSETYLKYAEFFYDLRDLNMSLYSMDHRGIGFSERMLPDRLKMPTSLCSRPFNRKPYRRAVPGELPGRVSGRGAVLAAV